MKITYEKRIKFEKELFGSLDYLEYDEKEGICYFFLPPYVTLGKTFGEPKILAFTESGSAIGAVNVRHFPPVEHADGRVEKKIARYLNHMGYDLGDMKSIMEKMGIEKGKILGGKCEVVL